MQDGYDLLADVDILEPNPADRRAANPRLLPFWMASEEKEMAGLWARGCFKRWKRSDLLKSDRVFGSSFHYNINLTTQQRALSPGIELQGPPGRPW
eukprot:2169570-Rhodomonas_salina.2